MHNPRGPKQYHNTIMRGLPFDFLNMFRLFSVEMPCKGNTATIAGNQNINGDTLNRATGDAVSGKYASYRFSSTSTFDEIFSTIIFL